MHFTSRIPYKPALPLALILLILTGCVPIVAGGVVGAGSYAVIRDKTVGDTINDTKIEAIIKSKLYKVSPDMYSCVSVNVNNGCVLLTGSITNPEWPAIAEKESWATNGVTVVDNNIVVGKVLGLTTMLKDGAITTNARASLLCGKHINSTNYKLKTMDSVLYITGTAHSQRELDIVLHKLQRISGIKKVVSYVVVNKSSKIETPN